MFWTIFKDDKRSQGNNLLKACTFREDKFLVHKGDTDYSIKIFVCHIQMNCLENFDLTFLLLVQPKCMTIFEVTGNFWLVLLYIMEIHLFQDLWPNGLQLNDNFWKKYWYNWEGYWLRWKISLRENRNNHLEVLYKNAVQIEQWNTRAIIEICSKLTVMTRDLASFW